MISVAISSNFQARVPQVALGCLSARVQVTEHDERLWRESEAAAGPFRAMTMTETRRRGPIKALRDAYRPKQPRLSPLSSSWGDKPCFPK